MAYLFEYNVKCLNLTSQQALYGFEETYMDHTQCDALYQP